MERGGSWGHRGGGWGGTLATPRRGRGVGEITGRVGRGAMKSVGRKTDNRQTGGAVRVARASGARGSGEKGAGLKGSIHGRVTHEWTWLGRGGNRGRKRKRHGIARSARRRKGSGVGTRRVWRPGTGAASRVQPRRGCARYGLGRGRRTGGFWEVFENSETGARGCPTRKGKTAR